jgi:protein TonB
MTEKRKKDKIIGWAICVGIHSAMLLLFFFLLAWKRPNPPAPEYGVELNFGLVESGAGDIQPQSEEIVEEPQEEVEEEVTEEFEETLPESEPETVTEPEETVTEEPVTTSDNDLPAVETKEEETKKPTPDPKSLFPPKNNNTTKGEETNDAKSQGDQAQGGDQGDPDGDLEEKALYGNQGGGDGAFLDMLNWNWDTAPQVNDPSNESGRIIFQIQIDENGEVIGVKTLQKTVSPGVERLYREAVYKLTFSPTSPSARPEVGATGKITFVIRSN